MDDCEATFQELSILHQPSLPWGRSKIPPHGEVVSILLGKSYSNDDEPTNQEGNEQTRSNKANGIVGNWTKPIQHRVQTSNSDKSQGISWFYYWIYLNRRREYVGYNNIMDSPHGWIVSTEYGRVGVVLTSLEGDILKYEYNSNSLPPTTRRSTRRY